MAGARGRILLMAICKRFDIDTLLDEVVTLPSMPATLAPIMELLDDPECNLGEVAGVISSDPSIALKTLRLVNSAYYGLGQEVTTIEHAVVLLGVKVIRNLALTATVFDTMKGSPNRFLKHCVGCGVAMRALAEASPLAKHVASADEAFVYGLLHDIGKVILGEYLAEEYAKIAELCREGGLAWYQAEQERIGVDHAILGARLAEKWKLSKSIVDAIAGHHDVGQVEEDGRLVTATLGVADYVVSASGLPSHKDPVFNISEDLWAYSAIDSKMTPQILERFFESFPTIGELLVIAV